MVYTTLSQHLLCSGDDATDALSSRIPRISGFPQNQTSLVFYVERHASSYITFPVYSIVYA